MLVGSCLINLLKFGKSKINSFLSMSTKVTPLDEVRNCMGEIFVKGVEAVLPRNLIENRLKLEGDTLFVGEQSFQLLPNVYLIGFGKAVMNMVPGIERILGTRLKKGIISVPKGAMETIWKVQDFANFPNLHGPIKYREGAKNNQPDTDSVSTTHDIMDLVEGLQQGDTLIVLISGGGSALLCMPRPMLELKEKQALCKRLQDAGADIRELNSVRKQLSMVKGGGLAQLAYPASVISLILSDIVGDPIAEIASGPTVYSPQSPDEITGILKKYGLFDDLDWNIKTAIASKNNINSKDLLNANQQFKHVHNIIIGNNSIAIEAAKTESLKRGFSPIILRKDVEGDVSNVSIAYVTVVNLICMALEKSLDRESFFTAIKQVPIMSLSEKTIDHIYDVVEDVTGQGIILIGGGEPTVIVRGNGVGGRNQQLALQFSLDWMAKVKENPHLTKYDVVFLSGGTDGQDGPTDAAGAFGYPAIAPIIYNIRNELQVQVQQTVSREMNRQNTIVNKRVEQNESIDDESNDKHQESLVLKLEVIEKILPENVLDNNDAYNFYSRFKKGKDLLKTGLTGTNVMDLHIISITKRGCACRVDFEIDSKCPDSLDEHNLDVDSVAIKTQQTETYDISQESKLLNLKVLDDTLEDSCCNRARKE
ncbi:glycerate kinase [Athalia rosae]|uniref:glycerate kinase n=1 Tax=Athalia rosae TaxID=37344 RepID=UPI0020338C0C|nr:glycerate kinase [Athalia rosae]